MDRNLPRIGVRSASLLLGLLVAGLAELAHNEEIPGADQLLILAAKWLGPLGAWGIVLSPLLAASLMGHLVAQRRHQRRELHEQQIAQQRADDLARQDVLTGLLNRRGLLDGVEQLTPATRLRGQGLALLIIDLDHFKKINDLHGHVIGDHLLREVGARLADCCPAGALIARLGGDEFAVAIEYEPQFPIVVDTIARAIVSKMCKPIVVGDLQLHVGASVGIASSSKDDCYDTGLIRQADMAMYRAKHGGRNCACWFDGSMEAELKNRAELESLMRLALKCDQFVPYFEPQVDFVTGRVSGFEVLARWHHPERGSIPPDVFIPVAEETGLIGEISTKIVEQALLAARDWDSGITLAVNISPIQLRDPTLAHRLLKLVVATRFPPDRLEVEITESALMGDMATAKAVITSLKNQGIQLALDDFGTGYSSLHHLRALPFDRIKIDRSFVSSILDNEESAAIVNAVLGLGESLGMDVIAEGIETQEIQDQLRSINCRNGQGYFYSRAVPADQVPAVVAKVTRLVSIEPVEKKVSVRPHAPKNIGLVRKVARA